MIEQNRAALGLVTVLIVLVLGFLWWQFMYKPATADHTQAVSNNQSAQSALSDARANLAKAQEQVDAAKAANGGKFDASIADVQVSHEAIPRNAQIDDALVVLSKYATQSGIRTDWSLNEDGSSDSDSSVTSSSASGSAGGATPINITVKAAGKWSQLKTFIDLVESSANEERGQLYIKGRLFNVTRVGVTAPDVTDSSSTSPANGMMPGQPGTPNAVQARPGEYSYDITITMYTSDFGGGGSTATAGGAGVASGSASASDASSAAAAGASGSASSAGSPSATSTAGGAASAGGGATSATSPTGGIAGATPSTGMSGATTPTAGGATPSMGGSSSPAGATTPGSSSLGQTTGATG